MADIDKGLPNVKLPDELLGEQVVEEVDIAEELG